MNRTYWECQNCGAQFPKWAGKCTECGKWNCLVETVATTDSASPTVPSRGPVADVKPLPWRKFKSESNKLHIPTDIGELDRALGGGLVPGGVILIAGEPGIGKSTLLSHLALGIKTEGKRQKEKGQAGNRHTSVLYVNGEESSLQVAARFHRLKSSSQSKVDLFPQTNVEAVVAEIERRDGTALLIADSIQVMSSSKLRSAAGSIGQIRESAGRLIEVAKRKNIPTILVGHFTKEGEVAGPKVLEHMVDTVLVMEGDRSGNLRILRCLKNRFGPVDEVGIFSMSEAGMTEVKNPAELLIGESGGQAPGSVLGCVLEGQRPLALEVQALVVPSKLAVPRRVGHGINQQRLALLAAVIEKHVTRRLGEMDVYINVAGGLSSRDPGLDLAVVAAIISSQVQKLLNTRSVRESEDQGSGKSERSARILRSSDSRTFRPSEFSEFSESAQAPIFCGEVGLLGEVRPVAGWQRREKEVARLGMGRLLGSNLIKSVSELQKFL